MRAFTKKTQARNNEQKTDLLSRETPVIIPIDSETDTAEEMEYN